jgi:hypothetical protein
VTWSGPALSIGVGIGFPEAVIDATPGGTVDDNPSDWIDAARRAVDRGFAAVPERFARLGS